MRHQFDRHDFHLIIGSAILSEHNKWLRKNTWGNYHKIKLQFKFEEHMGTEPIVLSVTANYGKEKTCNMMGNDDAARPPCLDLSEVAISQ